MTYELNADVYCTVLNAISREMLTWIRGLADPNCCNQVYFNNRLEECKAALRALGMSEDSIDGSIRILKAGMRT